MNKKIDILFVEDDPSIYVMYEAMLKTFTKYTYKIASNEADFLELIDKYEFRLCVMDIRLSGPNNGVELSLKIKEKHPDIIIYAMTGYPQIFDGFDSNIAGISKVFSKPGDFTPLCKSIVGDLGTE